MWVGAKRSERRRTQSPAAATARRQREYDAVDIARCRRFPDVVAAGDCVRAKTPLRSVLTLTSIAPTPLVVHFRCRRIDTIHIYNRRTVVDIKHRLKKLELFFTAGCVPISRGAEATSEGAQAPFVSLPWEKKGNAPFFFYSSLIYSILFLSILAGENSAFALTRYCSAVLALFRISFLDAF
jgi:hypothetical protein